MPSFNIFGYWITFEFNTLHFDYYLSLLLLLTLCLFLSRNFKPCLTPSPKRKWVNGGTDIDPNLPAITPLNVIN